MIGAIEEGTPEEYRPLFETSVFGVIETTRAVLPSWRRSGGGRIVMVSSGAGIAGIAGDGYCNATKFALEGLSEALAQEVAPFGIAVVIVEPGRAAATRVSTSVGRASVVVTKHLLAGTAPAPGSRRGGVRVMRGVRRSRGAGARPR
jgi:NAD(P)-dependent dehydrogenase (short-subunit alcohol dehydrogenase family)